MCKIWIQPDEISPTTRGGLRLYYIYTYVQLMVPFKPSNFPDGVSLNNLEVFCNKQHINILIRSDGYSILTDKVSWVVSVLWYFRLI